MGHERLMGAEFQAGRRQLLEMGGWGLPCSVQALNVTKLST